MKIASNILGWIRDTFLSRKFLGFAIATWLCYAGKMTDLVWLGVYGLYVGSNIAEKYLMNKKGE